MATKWDDRFIKLGKDFDPAKRLIRYDPAVPHPGDVIFTKSPTKEAFGSCFLQRLLLNKLVGPWFSHVSVALSSRTVIEAYPEDDGERTWSDATLGEGVRLRLLPDLLKASSNRAVLRHPNAASL